ncbi:alanine/glycine:cation symporter family protein [Paludibacterium paludis]|uniref:Sodium:alanine symporter n=1 Tax=Paludibacterium paludis TaxID=1225769 RepID=A0A918P091_9NEIS|nr:sodium:alanine symporter family protein [Paludibacterium paludis]GGY10871.1 sodium:alanine symporter [Paludibacterium paludis]
MQYLHALIIQGNSVLWGHILIYLLIATGVFFTLRTRVIQLRLLGQAVREMFAERDKGKNTITPFQAFATGLASRVGTGNMAGVAIAIAAGGPGAVFWMWITAFIGMGSAFAESTLAQLFKVSHRDGSYRGGPAYYIKQGLGQKHLGGVFAALLILAFGLVFNAVQANSISAAAAGAWGWDARLVGIALVLATAPVIFGGIRAIARLAQWLVPFMAFIYLGMALVIVVMNSAALPDLLRLIVTHAFGIGQVAGGVAGHAVNQAMMMGIKRGLFSNEAGMGSAPNAAATAHARHPVSQGLIQMLGVFVDTMILCTATAAIILLTGAHESGLNGIQLTQKAVETQFGQPGNAVVTIAIFLFAFSSILGNYAYAEGNVEYLTRNKTTLRLFRLMVLGMVMFGSVGSLALVWDMADLAMGAMALINLMAILLLGRYVRLAQKDFEIQRASGKPHPVFLAGHYPALRAKLERGVW